MTTASDTHEERESLKLILLPPEQCEDITQEDIKIFYKNLANILMSEN